MPDPVTTIGLGALGAYLGKDGLEKLLGPTASYLGTGLKEFTQRRVEAVGKIFQSAQRKLGRNVDKPGEVPPKVLKMVVNEGSYATTPLEVEYFGGILASSRTESGRDDRGARLAKVVDSLSSYQLRTHYLVYTAIRAAFSDSGLRFDITGRPKMRIFIPLDDYTNAMEFNEKEIAQLFRLISHAFHGLHAESLIEEPWHFGDPDFLKRFYPKADTSGILCQPSSLGAELYLSVFGHAEEALEFIFQPNLTDGDLDLPSPLKRSGAPVA